MSSATVNEIDPNVAFAALEEACDVLEAGVSALARSIKEQKRDFILVRAVWDGQKYLSQACKDAPVTNGHDELWARVRAVKARAEDVLEISKRLHEERKTTENGNGYRVDGPSVVISIPQYLGKEKKARRRLSPAAEKRRDENRARARAKGAGTKSGGSRHSR